MEAFFDSLMRGVAVEAIDAATDEGLKTIVQRAGLDWSGAQQALKQSEWRDWVQQHRDEMTADGLWGVPSLRYGDLVTWGQDRFWLIRQKALGRNTPEPDRIAMPAFSVLSVWVSKTARKQCSDQTRSPVFRHPTAFHPGY